MVWGQQDRFLPVGHLDTLMRLVPHAKPVVLAPCGHAPMVERPADFSGIALDFLADPGAPLHLAQQAGLTPAGSRSERPC
ncbi:alpha/beta hydrolase fold protein [Hydrogenophaga taeniospiralis CCUG 15921]|uniref:Alpha/beta hydrolase fold protein n=1 Tax=Hydrogenophaga taeniospiralis CCUG 15921 TaxID=1281780 RepID=A0A9X4S758_9BURK|nr:alpha/beta hydrolase fold protein [Hydrogenophaga taeniospiralis CCUG 15921]